MTPAPIELPRDLNYVAAFLTLDCNYSCPYCINHAYPTLSLWKMLSGKAWVEGLNRLQLEDVPITFQGGEPTLHPEFFTILNGLRADIHIDLLTNLSFDIDEFSRSVEPSRFFREAPYAPIRATLHPNACDPDVFLAKAATLKSRGYSVGVYLIRTPGEESIRNTVVQKCLELGLDCREKDFLGRHKGEIFGNFHHPNGVFSIRRKTCLCRTSELLISPDGGIFRCHRDLYKNELRVAELSNPILPSLFAFRACHHFGECNPCDLKVKNNRFQQAGFSSVEICFTTPDNAD